MPNEYEERIRERQRLARRAMLRERDDGVVRPTIGKSTLAQQQEGDGLPATGPYQGSIFNLRRQDELDPVRRPQGTQPPPRKPAPPKPEETKKQDSEKETEGEQKRKRVQAPKAPRVDLSNVPIDEGTSWTDPETGVYRESRSGSSVTDPTKIVAPKGQVKTDGTSSATIAKRASATGNREQLGIRGSKTVPGKGTIEGDAVLNAEAGRSWSLETSDKGISATAAASAEASATAKGSITKEEWFGTTKLSGQARAAAEAGVGGSAEINKDGFEVSGGVDVGISAKGRADIDIKTHELKLDGVTDPLTAGYGVGGELVADARIGAGVKVGANKDYVGFEANAGAFAGFEANADVRLALGPLGVKLTGGGIAGAGADADAAIVYQNGKVRIRMKARAAVEVGGSGAVELELDLRQAIELGYVTIVSAYETADADGNKVLSMNDGATLASNGLNNAAKTFDQTTTSALDFLDADGSGKIRPGDVSTLAERGIDTVTEKVTATKDAIVDSVDKKLEQAGDALDYDKDNKVELSDVASLLGDTIVSGLEFTRSTAEKGFALSRKVDEDVAAQRRELAERVIKAGDLDGDGDSFDGGDVMVAFDRAVETSKAIADNVETFVEDKLAKLGDALDVNDDKSVGISDGVELAKRAVKTVQDTEKAVRERNIETGKKVYRGGKAAAQKTLDTAKWVFRGGVRYLRSLPAKLKQLGDRNHDGSVDWRDVPAGMRQVAQRGKSAVTTLGRGAIRAGGAVYRTITAAVTYVKNDVVQAAQTFKAGVVSAWNTATGALSNAWNKIW